MTCGSSGSDDLTQAVLTSSLDVFGRKLAVLRNARGLANRVGNLSEQLAGPKKPYCWDMGKPFRALVRSLGIEDIRLHDLRHTPGRPVC